MLKEAIQLMRELWTGKTVGFDGDYYQTRKARLYTMPQQPIELYISSLVPESADFAGEYGDGLITTGGRSPEQYKQMLAAFEKGARQAGKDPEKMPKLIELSVAYAPVVDRVIQEVKKYWAGTFIPAMYTQRIYTPKMSAENGKVVGEETIRQKGCFSSDPDEHLEFARRYMELGFDRLYFHYAGQD